MSRWCGLVPFSVWAGDELRRGDMEASGVVGCFLLVRVTCATYPRLTPLRPQETLQQMVQLCRGAGVAGGLTPAETDDLACSAEQTGRLRLVGAGDDRPRRCAAVVADVSEAGDHLGRFTSTW